MTSSTGLSCSSMGMLSTTFKSHHVTRLSRGTHLFPEGQGHDSGSVGGLSLGFLDPGVVVTPSSTQPEEGRGGGW